MQPTGTRASKNVKMFGEEVVANTKATAGRSTLLRFLVILRGREQNLERPNWVS
jgi:hypothetical protein